MASGSPTSNFMPLQPCNAKSDLSASRYSSWWAMRRGASLRTRSGANPAFRSDRPPRKCFFSLTRITSPARPVTTYKERAQLAMRRAGGARSNRRCIPCGKHLSALMRSLWLPCLRWDAMRPQLLERAALPVYRGVFIGRSMPSACKPERAISPLNTCPNPPPTPASISHVAFCRSLFYGNCFHHLQMRSVTG